MSKEMKAKLIAMVCALGLIPKEFTGKLTFNINAGVLCDVEKLERFK